MIFKQVENKLFLKVFLLFAVLCLGAYLLVNQQIKFFVLLMPLIIYQLYDLYKSQRKAQDELNQFVESVHYRDFSRYFDVKHAPAELQPLRHGFNEINSTFKVISKEKETQYQYLQKILELVDTGILSFDMTDGQVVWMNESLKKMLHLPYLKSIQSLEKRDPGLFQVLDNLRPGESRLTNVSLDNTNFKILVSCTAFQTSESQYKLVAFQNVNEAMDETESKAWQKLLNVMTHEIMNSVAPISSLADTLKNRLQQAATEIRDETGTLEDLDLGIETIKRRSEGLLRFAETYRNLNKISELHLEKVYVFDIFRNLQQLMSPTLDQKNIELEILLKDMDISLQADINLLEQVLINLLVNAMDAVKENPHPKIVLSAAMTPNRKPMIKVADNGSGMSQEVLDKIFVPFFSTKKTGSGIGLSLCKQIMMLHKGSIQVQSVEGEGTAFLLQF
ncbi:sensor histidine kinase [Flavihumibacter petaseus]|uniref:histidine kinase n=1 Tax=Flavihumibacter petaseus NBRC 106054 TaxID=1220578 RepID=A0A0E9N3N4_9BACT|nr:HAMP domain-containing sensor histidine kinase [Flavihumibacter petaseus]GAO44388.1 putative two-component histidine kinase [Flavihumibacter petaseus NBRC 106054]